MQVNTTDNYMIIRNYSGKREKGGTREGGYISYTKSANNKTR